MATFSDNLVRLRQEMGFTQEALAKQLGITRATYIKLERGQSSPTLEQMKRLADCLEVPVKALIDEKPAATRVKPQSVKRPSRKAGDGKRPTTKVDLAKLESVLLYVLNKVGSQPNIGETVLCKILYFIDFDYYEHHDQSITGLRYYHNHSGPTPDPAFQSLTMEMIANGKLQIVETKFYDKVQKKYLASLDPDLTRLSGQEVEHINDVLGRLGHKTAQEITDYVHQDTPWIATKPGQPIDYRLAKYRTTVTSVIPPADDEL